MRARLIKISNVGISFVGYQIQILNDENRELSSSVRLSAATLLQHSLQRLFWLTNELLHVPSATRIPATTMNGTKPIMPAPELPEGWKAVWNGMHDEWFYVNLHTSQTTWEKPTTPALPSINNTVHLNDHVTSPVVTQSKMAANVSVIPSHNPHNSDKVATTRLEDDLVFEKEILADFDFDGSGKSSSSIESSSGTIAWSRKHSCRVLIKRYSKLDPAKIAAAQRELNVLHALAGSDNTIPPLLDYFDPANTIFVVCENRKDESLRRYVEGRGPLTGDLLKAVVTQLMSALAYIFMNGFAHLRMCDETLFIDENGQLTVKDFQYAVPYDTEKTDDLYAGVGHDVSRADGIWCAPEVYTAEKENTRYNGRKAVIWSCGVVIVRFLVVAL